MRSLSGRTLGSYRLIEQVGIGGMAVIYKAYDPALDRYVAIKILPEYLGHDEQFSQRFRNEARNVARLRHPNILPIYGYGEEDGLSYFVMELVEGGTLKDLMGTPMDPRQAAHLIGQVSDALEYAHHQPRPIVHRDVKPANILMSRPDWPLLSDFGIARVLEEQAALTRSAFLGTPHYMSPEQARGEAIGPKTDQYALGIVLYEMLTGTPPYHADTPQAVVYQHIYARLPLPHERNPQIGEAMERVILKALAKDPNDRFDDMASFGAAVRAAAGGSVGPVQSGAQADSQERMTSLPPQPASPPEEEVARTAGNSNPNTERIAPVPVPAVTAVSTEKGGAAAPPPAAHSGARRPLLLGLGGAVVLAAAAGAFALFHGSSLGTASADAVLRFTNGSGSMPAVTVNDSQNNQVASITPDGAASGTHLRPGAYVLAFDGSAGFHGNLPVTLGSGNDTIDLTHQMAFVQVLPAKDTPLQGGEVDDSRHSYQFSLTAGDLTSGFGMPPGSAYQLNLNSNADYVSAVPFTAVAGQHVTLGLAHLFGRVVLHIAQGMPPPDAEVKDSNGTYLHDVKAIQVEKGVYLLPGRYLLDLSSSGPYLDTIPVTVQGGASATVHLERTFGQLRITQLPNSGMDHADLQDSGGNSIHSYIALKDLVSGVYVHPGTYLLAPTGSNYIQPIPVSVRRGGSTLVDLPHKYGSLTVSAPASAPLTSYEIDDSTGQNLHTSSGSDVFQTAYLRPGAYTIKPSSDSAAFVDGITVRIQAMKAKHMDLGAMLAAVQVPAAPKGGSLSYAWTDPYSNTSQTVDAGSKPQMAYVLPGIYRVEVSGTSSRIVTVRAVAGKTTRLPGG